MKKTINEAVMKRELIKTALLPLVLLALLAVSCRHDRNQPGYAYMPDMYYSEPYDSYTPNPVFDDSVTNQLPVKGTIPRGYIPYPYKAKSFDDQIRAGAELVNPVAKTPESLAAGKEQYTIYCAICHGTLGKGDGPLHKSGKFAARPTSLVDSLVQNKKDGEIYHVITVGSLSGLMGAHGPQISPVNRWNIIHYVRELGQSQTR
jgi:mono/diheme cytochrome c family protein